jgi:hypothetical protein
MTDDEKALLLVVVAPLLRHATYSFGPINWDYAALTATEKEILSPDEFEAIKKMAQTMSMQPLTPVLSE